MSRIAVFSLLGIAFWLLNVSATIDEDSTNTSTPDLFSPISITNTMPSNFSCVGEVIVTLDDNCEAELTIPMVLKGNGVETLKGYTITVLYDDNSKTVNEVKGCGTFDYEVYDNLNALVCGGKITAEDKTAPIIKSAVIADTLTCTDIDSIYNVGLFDFDNQVWKRLKDKEIFSIRDSVSDNCSAFDHLEWVIEDYFHSEEEDCEVLGRIFRVFQATDEKGNVSLADSIEFVFLQPELLLDEIKENVELNLCIEEGTELVLTAEQAGAPFYINGFGEKLYIYDQDITLCKYGIAFVDDSIPSNCGFKIIRDWLITDWCTNEITTHQQILKYGDLEAPEVFCPAGIFDNSFSTTSLDCVADINIPRPSVRDNCDNSNWTYSVEVWSRVPETDIFGIPTGDTIVVQPDYIISGDSENGYIVSDVPIGEHFFYYFVVDACGNAAEVAICPFEVFDGIPPVAVCVDLVNISLGGQGSGKVLVEDIDEGSNDNCRLESLTLRRQIKENCLDAYVDALLGDGQGIFTFNDLTKDEDADIWRFEGDVIITKQGIDYFSDYMDNVVVSCCDVGTFVNIELRITDQAGNRNSCWTIAQVEDKIAPICLAPANVTVNCDTLTIDRNNFGDTLQLQRYFGNALSDDNCEASTLELSPVVNLGACDLGTITRTFQAKDKSGNQSTDECKQVITIEGVFEYKIDFPADESAVSCGFTPADTVAETTDLGCGIFAIDVTTERLAASGDECYKEFRTYTLINWCEYDGSLEPIVIGRDEDMDGIPGENVHLIRRRDGTYYIDDNDDETDGFIRSATGSKGFWQYSQIIKVYDQESPTVQWQSETEFCSFDTPSSADEECTGEVHLSFIVDDRCTPDELSTTLSIDFYADGANQVNISETDLTLTQEGNVYTLSGVFALGRHRIQARASDPCGNFTVRSFEFEVVDCKAPSPICRQGLSVPLMPMDMDGNGVPDFGMAMVDALGFIGSEVFDCSGGLSYSISRKGEPAIREQTEIMVNCLDPFGETIPVEVYAWDALGNHNACETFIIVTDNNNLCSGGIENGVVSGFIETVDAIPLENVSVKLSGSKNSAVNTNIDGLFEFVDLEEGKDYTITPESTDPDYINGVSTYDMVLISRHILGVDLLDTPYKVIAADVNGSNSVTTIDLIQMRKLILSVANSFPENASWRFIRADYEFPNPKAPWEGGIPEFTNINDLLGTDDMVDFIAVKVGDINGSVRISQTSANLERRSVGQALELNIQDQLLSAGNTYQLPITASNINDFIGSQFTLSFDAELLQLQNIEYGLFSENNLGLKFLEDGLITTSWNDFASHDNNEVLFTLHLTPKVELKWSDVINLSSRLLTAEAYTTEGEFREVTLNVTPSLEQEGIFELHQNTPNPFHHETIVKFNLPEASEVTITVYEPNGQVVQEFNNFYDAGLNQLVINGENFKSGVLYYHLQTKSYQATKKMVFID